MKYIIISFFLLCQGCQTQNKTIPSSQKNGGEDFKIEDVLKLIDKPLDSGRVFIENKRWVFLKTNDEVDIEYKKSHAWRQNDSLLSDYFILFETENGNISTVKKTINELEYNIEIPAELENLGYKSLGIDTVEKIIIINSYGRQISKSAAYFVELSNNTLWDSLRYKITISKVFVPDSHN